MSNPAGTGEPRDLPAPEQRAELWLTATRPHPVRALPGQAALDTDEGSRAGLVTRIVIAATVVFGQLWALVVGLDRYLVGHTGQAWMLFGFSAASFLVVVALTVIRPAQRRDLRRFGRPTTQSAGLYRPAPAGQHAEHSAQTVRPLDRPYGHR